MPYNIELMDKPLEEYIQKKQKIRIRVVFFKGKREHHASASEYQAGVCFW
mgnify:CR=1 FL=1